MAENRTKEQLIRELAEARQRISELERAAHHEETDKAFLESRIQLQAVLDASLDAITLTNEQGIFLACNKALSERWGKPCEQLVGHSASEVLPPAIFQNRLDRVRHVIRTGESDHFIDERDGQWFENTISPIREADGSIRIVALFSRDITERKRAEKALSESEKKYRELVESATSIILRWNRHGEITFMNEFGLNFFGYSQEELIGRNVMGTIVPETESTGRDLHPLMEKIREDPLKFERNINENMRSNGDRVWIDWTNKVVLNDQGELVEILSIGSDITERRRMERSLAEKEARMRTLVQTIPDLIWLKDADGVYLACNTRFERFFGAREMDIIGKPDYDFVDREQADFFRENDLKAIAAGKPCSNEEWFTFADNGYRGLFDAIKIPMYSAEGKLVGVLGIARDITERKRSEEVLMQSEERLRNILEFANIGIWEEDFSTGAFWRSSYHDQIFGYTEPLPEWTYETFLEHVLPEDRPKINEMHSRPMAYPTQVNFECRIRRVDGEQRWIWIQGNSVVNEGNEVVKLTGILRDITEQKRAEADLQKAYDELDQRVRERTAELTSANERLQELDRLKSQFLATMSHELRTPLNSIIGFTGILLQGFAGPINEEQKKQLEMAYNSAKHLLSLINDLLDLSRIEAGKLDFEHEPFDFSEVVTEVIENLKPAAEQKGLNLVADLHDSSIPMKGDRKRCFQILLNLVNNGVKFTEKGEVRITSGIEGKALRVSVSDTGIGIRPENIRLLFEAFRQVDGSAKRVYEGTGLGLYLCRTLLTLMGGGITVQSEFGKGSVFTFTMPIIYEG